MAQLIVRNLEDDIVAALKARASTHNRSAEAEHRAILRDALLQTPSASEDWFDRARALRNASSLRISEPPTSCGRIETETTQPLANATMHHVVDASVAVKWLVREDGSAAADELRDLSLHAPTLLQVEVANVLRTLTARNTMTGSDAAEAFDLLFDAPIIWHEPNSAMMRAALAIALALGHPVYDCIYLAHAIDLGVPLITADRRFHRAVSGHKDFSGITNLLGETLD